MSKDTRRGWFRLRQALAGLAVMLAGGGWAVAQNGNDGFAPAVTAGSVYDVVVDNNGKVLIGGDFTYAAGSRRVARLLPDGSRDNAFNFGLSATSGYVRSILPIGNGYLVGGTFTGGSSPDYLAQLDNSGNNVGALSVAVNGNVNKVARRFANNGYYIGGQFTWVNGATRHGIARLTAGLASDTSFVTPTFTGTINDITEQPNGRVIVAGAFLQITGNPGAGYAVFRLNSNGSLDTSFNFDAVAHGLNHVNAIALQPDGKVLIAGSFTATVGSEQRQHMARLNADGSVDLSFDPPSLNGQVLDMAVQPDGRIVISGPFTGLGLNNDIVRLHANGAVDTSFSVLLDPDNLVRAVAVQGDGGLLFAGDFTAITGVPSLRVARTPKTGFVDRSFDPGGTVNNDVLTMAVLASSDVIAGGAFTSIAGQSRTYLARFSGGTGLLSNGFTPTLDGAVHAVVAQPDGKLLIGGAFQLVNGSTRRRVARLNADGTLDTSFVPANIPDGIVFAIEVDPAGRIYVGGSFQNVGGAARRHLVRLLANGSVDSDFVDHDVDGSVHAITMAGDQYRVYIGGKFSEIDGYERSGLARMWPNGGLNTGFQASCPSFFCGGVYSLAVPADGLGVIAGGDFSRVEGPVGTPYARRHIARFLDDGVVDADFISDDSTRRINAPVQAIHTTHDGLLYVGGSFSQVGSNNRRALVRLHADTAAVDATFDAQATNVSLLQPSWVNALAMQGDGRLLVGGRFDLLGGVGRANIGRLGNRDAITDETLSFVAPNTVQWLRQDTGIGLRGKPELLISTTCCSSASFTPLPGTMTWSFLVGGSWRYSGFSNPFGVYYLRTRARIGDSNGSGYYESPIYRFDGGEAPEAEADLTVSLFVSPTSAEPGQTVTFTVVVSNQGPDAAPETVVVDELPDGFTYVSHGVTQGSFDPATGKWSVGTVATASRGTGGTQSLTLQALVNAVGEHVNLASGSSDAFDPNVLDNVDWAEVIVLEPNNDTIFANGFQQP